MKIQKCQNKGRSRGKQGQRRRQNKEGAWAKLVTKPKSEGAEAKDMAEEVKENGEAFQKETTKKRREGLILDLNKEARWRHSLKQRRKIQKVWFLHKTSLHKPTP